MFENFLKNAKAYVGLIGAIITGLLGTVPPDGQVWQVLTYVSAVLTAITIYQVPNKDVTGEHQDESVQPVEGERHYDSAEDFEEDTPLEYDHEPSHEDPAVATILDNTNPPRSVRRMDEPS